MSLWTLKIERELLTMNDSSSVHIILLYTIVSDDSINGFLSFLYSFAGGGAPHS